jgi:hypothetical protein
MIHCTCEYYIFHTVLGNKIYVCGGSSTARNQILSSMEMYNVQTGQLDQSFPECPYLGVFLSFIAIPDNQI